MSSIDIRAVPDLRSVPERIAVPSHTAPQRRWGTTTLRVVGGFVLTGVFLALSAVVFALCGIYGFVGFAGLG